MLFTEKTVVEVIEILRLRGYTADFNLLEENLSCTVGGVCEDLSDIVIDRVYRFTGMSDLDDESTLYAMRNTKTEVKGIFLNGYGIYSDAKADEILRNIHMAVDDGKEWEK